MDEWTSMAEKDKIGRYVESFRQLAGLFCHMPDRKEGLNEEDIQDIFEMTKEKVCASCGRRQVCWIREAEKTWRLAYGLLMAVEDGRDAVSEKERDFYRYCVKGRSFREELEHGFSRARLNMLWSNRMLENRAAVGQQLQETAQIIEEIACTVYEAREPMGDLEKRVKMHLRMHRVNVKDMGLMKNIAGHPEVILTMSCWGSSVAVREIAEVLSEVYGRYMVPLRDSRLTIGKEPCAVHFVEETKYYMLTGSAMEKSSGQISSGDNFAVLNSNHGQVVMAISDGMGSGVRANQESQTVIELLEQFLEAGFSAETAVKMIHSAMVLQNGMMQYSTLDICEVDLYRGVCKMLKIGASATFIKRGKEVEAVHSTSLPVGMLQQADIERTTEKLKDGDCIVMISDGVLEVLPEKDGEELLKYFVRELTTDNPAQSAQILMKQVLEFCQERIPDDMTILVGGFWRK